MENQKRLILLASIISVALISSVIWIQGLPIGSTDLQIDDSGWRFIVDGYVQNSLNLTLNRIRTMPKTTLYAELICVGSPAFITEKGNWTGVKLGYILDEESNILGKVPTSELNSTLRSLGSGVHAVIFDGIITDEIVRIAENSNVKFLIAMDTKVKPEDTRLNILTNVNI